MLQVDDVHKSYRQGGSQVAALRGVSMAIDQPGFYAVMGPSGSGKTTLLHLIGGLDRADRGTIRVADQALEAMSEGALTRFRRLRVGVVFQKFNLIPTLTLAQNVALPAVIDGRARRWTRQRVDVLLDELGLTPRAGHRPDALSGGEQQRAAIARALMFDPPLLLADEPTGNLDSASSDRLWALLAEVAGRQKMSVVMVTHEPAAAAHCREVFVLRDGQLRGRFEVNGLDASGVASRYQQFER